MSTVNTAFICVEDSLNSAEWHLSVAQAQVQVILGDRDGDASLHQKVCAIDDRLRRLIAEAGKLGVAVERARASKGS